MNDWDDKNNCDVGEDDYQDTIDLPSATETSVDFVTHDPVVVVLSQTHQPSLEEAEAELNEEEIDNR